MPPLDGAAEWLNSEPLGPADLRGRVVLVELLDADLHQLAAPGAVRPCLVAGLPRRRAGRHRGAHAGVLVRARRRPGAAGGRGASDRLPGRGRQRLRDLARVRQPLLAGALLRRRRRRHPRRALRRRTLRAVGAGASSNCSASSATSSPSKGSASRRRPTGTTCARPRRTSATGAASTSRQPDGAALDERRAYELPEQPAASTSGRSPATGRSGAENVVLDQAGGSIAFRFHARDAHLVLAPGAGGPIPFRVLARRRGSRARRTASTSTRTATACSEDGRLYQLVRQARRGPRADPGDHVRRARRRGVRLHFG